MSAAGPNLAPIHALIDVRRYAEARARLAAALSEHPDDAALHALMAVALLDDGQPGPALPYADRACAIAPNVAHHHLLRALALSRLGRPSAALRAAHEVVRLAPYHWRSHSILGQVMVDAGGDRDAARAAAAAQRGVELAPSVAEAHFAVGYVAQQSGRRREARRAYERVLSIDPDHSATLTNLGTLAGMRLGAATRNFLAALRLDPQSRAARQRLEEIPGALWGLLVVTSVVVALLGLVLTTSGHGLSGSTPTTASRLVGIAGPALWLTYVVRTLRHIPRPVLTSKLHPRNWLSRGRLATAFSLVFIVLAELVCFTHGAARYVVYLLPRAVIVLAIALGRALFRRGRPISRRSGPAG